MLSAILGIFALLFTIVGMLCAAAAGSNKAVVGGASPSLTIISSVLHFIALLLAMAV